MEDAPNLTEISECVDSLNGYESDIEFIQQTQLIKTLAKAAIQTIAVNAINSGHMTHSAAARCAGVHPDTAKQWLTTTVQTSPVSDRNHHPATQL
jgi:hypothetical protein